MWIWQQNRNSEEKRSEILGIPGVKLRKNCLKGKALKKLIDNIHRPHMHTSGVQGGIKKRNEEKYFKNNGQIF